jgi:membrane-associated protein
VLLLGCFIAAVAGDSVGYAFGQRVGRKLFQRENSFLFNRKNMLRAEELYEKYGGKTIVIARFIPVIRTFAPIVAGIGSMQYRQFLIYNLLGGSLWAIGVTMAGYFLGSSIPNVDRYLLPIVAIIILISVAPAIYHVLKDQERRQSLMLLVQRFVSRSPVE